MEWIQFELPGDYFSFPSSDFHFDAYVNVAISRRR